MSNENNTVCSAFLFTKNTYTITKQTPNYLLYAFVDKITEKKGTKWTGLNLNKFFQRRKSLPNTLPARLLAMPPEYMALEAKLDAWLNLSQREKASVLVMVRTRAIAGAGAGGWRISKW